MSQIKKFKDPDAPIEVDETPIEIEQAVIDEPNKYGVYYDGNVAHVFGDTLYNQLISKSYDPEFDNIQRQLYDIARQPGGKYIYDAAKNIAYAIDPQGNVHTFQNRHRTGIDYVLGGMVNSRMNQYNGLLAKYHRGLLYTDDDVDKVTPTTMDNTAISLIPIDDNFGIDPMDQNTLSAIKRWSLISSYLNNPDEWKKKNVFPDENWESNLETLKTINKISPEIAAQVSNSLINGRLTPEQAKLLKLFGIGFKPKEVVEPVKDKVAAGTAVTDKKDADSEPEIVYTSGDDDVHPKPVVIDDDSKGHGTGTEITSKDAVDKTAQEQTVPETSGDTINFTTHYIPGMLDPTLTNVEDSYASIPWNKLRMAREDKTGDTWLELTSAADNKRYYIVRDSHGKYRANNNSKLFSEDTLKSHNIAFPDEKSWTDIKAISRTDGLRSSVKNSQEPDVVAIEHNSVKGLTGDTHSYTIWKNLRTGEKYIETGEGKSSVFRKISEQDENAIKTVKSSKIDGKTYSAYQILCVLIAKLPKVNIYNVVSSKKEGGILKFQEGTGKNKLTADISVTKGTKTTTEKEKKEHTGIGWQSAGFGLNIAGLTSALAGEAFNSPKLMRASVPLYLASSLANMGSIWANSSLTPGQKVTGTLETIPAIGLTAMAGMKTGGPKATENEWLKKEITSQVKSGDPIPEGVLKDWNEFKWPNAGNNVAGMLSNLLKWYSGVNGVNAIIDLSNDLEPGWTPRRIADISQIINAGGMFASNAIPMFKLNNLRALANKTNVSTGGIISDSTMGSLFKGYEKNAYGKTLMNDLYFSNKDAVRNALSKATTPNEFKLFNFSRGPLHTYNFYNPSAIKTFANPYMNPYTIGISPLIGNFGFIPSPYGSLKSVNIPRETGTEKTTVDSTATDSTMEDWFNEQNPYEGDTTKVKSDKRGGLIPKAQSGTVKEFWEELNKVNPGDKPLFDWNSNNVWEVIMNTQSDNEDFNKLKATMSAWNPRQRRAFNNFNQTARGGELTFSSLSKPFIGSYKTQDDESNSLKPLRNLENTKFWSAIDVDARNMSEKERALKNTIPLVQKQPVHFSRKAFNFNDNLTALNNTNASIDNGVRDYTRNISDGGTRSSIFVSGIEAKNNALNSSNKVISAKQDEITDYNRELGNKELFTNIERKDNSDLALANIIGEMADNRNESRTNAQKHFNDWLSTKENWIYQNAMNQSGITEKYQAANLYQRLAMLDPVKYKSAYENAQSDYLAQLKKIKYPV